MPDREWDSATFLFFTAALKGETNIKKIYRCKKIRRNDCQELRRAAMSRRLSALLVNLWLTPAKDEFCETGSAGFGVPFWQAGVADHIEQVSTDEGTAMTFRLSREEGLFAGTPTGANVIAALRLAERLGPRGMKYLRTYGAKLGS
jgi:hypothetical protein